MSFWKIPQDAQAAQAARPRFNTTPIRRMYCDYKFQTHSSVKYRLLLLTKFDASDIALSLDLY